MSHWAILAATVALLGAVGTAYHQGRLDGRDGELAARAREDHAARYAADTAASAAAAAIARIRVTQTTIRQEVEREIQTRTVYADCHHSPEQLQRLNAALASADPAAARSGELPASDPAP